MNIEGSFLTHFQDIKDPRFTTHRNYRHSLSDILIITI